VWRFTSSRLLSHAAEARAQKLVAVQFFLLTPYVGYEATHKLLTTEQAETSWIGIALVTSSLIGMPILGARSGGSPTSSDPLRRAAKERRTSYAPTSRRPSSPACWAMRFSVSGGSTRSPRSSSPSSPFASVLRAGAATAAAAAASSSRSSRSGLSPLGFRQPPRAIGRAATSPGDEADQDASASAMSWARFAGLRSTPAWRVDTHSPLPS